MKKRLGWVLGLSLLFSCSPKLDGAPCVSDNNCPTEQACNLSTGKCQACSLTCSGGLVCGFNGGAAACECPLNTIGVFKVDPTITNPQPNPTGLTTPAGCQFTTLTAAATAANQYVSRGTLGTTTAQVLLAPAPAAGPEQFTGESFPIELQPGVGVAPESSASTPDQYRIHYNHMNGSAFRLHEGTTLSGLTVQATSVDLSQANQDAIDVECAGSKPVTIDTVSMSGPTGANQFDSAVFVDAGCNVVLNNFQAQNPITGVKILGGAVSAQSLSISSFASVGIQVNDLVGTAASVTVDAGSIGNGPVGVQLTTTGTGSSGTFDYVTFNPVGTGFQVYSSVLNVVNTTTLPAQGINGGGSAGAGFDISGASNVFIQGVDVEGFSGDGGAALRARDTAVVTATDPNLTTPPLSFDTSSIGIDAQGAVHLSITNAFVELNQFEGVRATSGAQVSLIGTWVNSNCVTTLCTFPTGGAVHVNHATAILKELNTNIPAMVNGNAAVGIAVEDAGTVFLGVDGGAFPEVIVGDNAVGGLTVKDSNLNIRDSQIEGNNGFTGYPTEPVLTVLNPNPGFNVDIAGSLLQGGTPADRTVDMEGAAPNGSNPGFSLVQNIVDGGAIGVYLGGGLSLVAYNRINYANSYGVVVNPGASAAASGMTIGANLIKGNGFDRSGAVIPYSSGLALRGAQPTYFGLVGNALCNNAWSQMYVERSAWSVGDAGMAGCPATGQNAFFGYGSGSWGIAVDAGSFWTNEDAWAKAPVVGTDYTAGVTPNCPMVPATAMVCN